MPSITIRLNIKPETSRDKTYAIAIALMKSMVNTSDDNIRGAISIADDNDEGWADATERFVLISEPEKLANEADAAIMARAAGWDIQDGKIFYAKGYVSAEAAEKDVDGIIYDSWVECCEAEAIPKPTTYADDPEPDAPPAAPETLETLPSVLRGHAVVASVDSKGRVTPFVSALKVPDASPGDDHDPIPPGAPGDVRPYQGLGTVENVIKAKLDEALDVVLADYPGWRQKFHPLAASKGKAAIAELVSLIASVKAELTPARNQNVAN